MERGSQQHRYAARRPCACPACRLSGRDLGPHAARSQGHPFRFADPGPRDLRGTDAGNPVGVTIPTGVCHGFYFPEPSILVYSVTSYWSPDDELGCAWNAPELGLDWPVRNPVLSPRDRTAGSYQQMLDEYLAASALLADAHPA
ncbi:dTDP-4-dehydrorhamnose 3,5-epimerase family protein [uncultured Parvibaculum sp.]|uniref:dTDP-4-dehydrorhamnose 3,5-epimerase family protein n=1 Tax=uncultured Parvibaculum sp. TaxID=291828 RepID=UPI0030EC9F44